jgi:PilZ domain
MQKSSFGIREKPLAGGGATPPERRRASRKRTLLKGKLGYKNGSFAADCTIKDVSEAGAKVKVQPGLVIPDAIFLVDLMNCTAYNAKIMWRKADGLMGLTFSEKHPLDGSDTEFNVFKRYCDDHNVPGTRLRAP